ncbi:MAG: hypothetical protein FWD05_14135, partial [Oscillospiraceae bacterium]|nr:hypothetical protein [Oscillospiraceae bacterium]
MKTGITIVLLLSLVFSAILTTIAFAMDAVGADNEEHFDDIQIVEDVEENIEEDHGTGHIEPEQEIDSEGDTDENFVDSDYDNNVENDSNTPDGEQDLDERIDDEYLDEHEYSTEIMQTSESVFNVPSDFIAIDMGTGPGMTPGFGAAMNNNPWNLVLVLHENFSWSSELLISGNRHIIITSAGTDLATNETSLENNFVINRNGGNQRHFTVNGGATLTLSNITLEGGSPAGNRGGISILNGTLYMESNAVIRGNRASMGGGVEVSGVNARFIMRGGIIENNVAEHGGGVAIINRGQFHMHGGIIGREIEGILTVNTAGNHALSEGGGVYAAGQDCVFRLYGGTIAGNTAHSHGGGVRMHHHSTLYISEGESLISNNWTGVTGFTDPRGGGLSITAGANAEVHGGTIENNRALRGGGVMVDAGNSGGAAVGTLTIYGGTISNNRLQANGNPILEGGGLWVGQGQIGSNLPSHITILGGEISNNSANQGGGASVGQGGSLTIDLYGSSIKGNESTNNGGGVWVSGTSGTFRSTLHLIRGSIEDNTAVNNGGGVFVGNGGIFNMDNGDDKTTIENNRAQQGGGVYVEGGNFNMYGGVIGNNRYDGSNQVIAHGGGVCLSGENARFNMDSGRIDGNQAFRGGGIHILGNAKFNGIAGAIINNIATDDGGGMYVHYIFPDNLTNLNGVTIAPEFTFSNNEALNGLGINNELGLAQRSRIDPSIVTLSGEIIIDRVPATSENFTTIRPHAFTNHDINATGTFWRVTHEIKRGFVKDVTKYTAVVGASNHAIPGSPNGALLPHGAIVRFEAEPDERFENWIVSARESEFDEYGNPVAFTQERNEEDPRIQHTITEHTHVEANFISDSMLTISKTVTGDLANLTLDFEFLLIITDENGDFLPVGTEFNYVGGVIESSNATAPKDGKLTVESDGALRLWLRHGQFITIEEVPTYGTVQIIEEPVQGYIAYYIDSENPNNEIESNDTNVLPMT